MEKTTAWEEHPIEVLCIDSNISIRNGIASVIMSYIRNIDRNKFHFSILYFDERENTYENELRERKVDLYKINRKTLYRELKYFCKKHYGEFDIIHNHSVVFSGYFIGMKQKIGAKAYISHAHATKFGDTIIKDMRNRILSIPSLFISDYFAACSNDAGRKLFNKRKFTVIKNAISLEKFSLNLYDENNLKKELNIEGKYVVGHVGNMIPQKNHMFLLSVFKEIVKIRKDAVLILIGDGPLRKEIEQKTMDYELTDKIIFAGVTTEVNKYMQVMDVFVLPSHFEGLGIVLIEAQACGLPCVFSDAVPDDANIARKSNVVLSLKESSGTWANAVVNIDVTKHDNKKLIQDAGYEIKLAAKKLEDYYEQVNQNAV